MVATGTRTHLPEVALAQKPALTYDEVEALGYCSARLLRKLVATGRVRRCVLRAGRSVRFLQAVLVEELQPRK